MAFSGGHVDIGRFRSKDQLLKKLRSRGFWFNTLKKTHSVPRGATVGSLPVLFSGGVCLFGVIFLLE
jgi:hypothetical protein